MYSNREMRDSTEYAQRTTRGALIQWTVVVTLLTGVNMLVGFVTQVVLAARFGTGSAMDVYLGASVAILNLGTILVFLPTYVLVPTFAFISNHYDYEYLCASASNFFNVTLVFLAAVTLLFELGAETIVSVLLPGFTGNQLSEAVRIVRILSPILVLGGSIGVLTSLYYHFSSFVLPTVSGMLPQLGVLAFIVHSGFAPSADRIAWGTLVGTLARFGILVPILFRRMQWRRQLAPGSPEIRRAIRLALPLLGGGFTGLFIPVVDRAFASALAEGSISYLGYALRIPQLLMTLTIQPATVIFPKLSDYIVKTDIRGFIQHFFLALRLSWFGALPGIAVFSVLSYPLVQLVFQRGGFDQISTGAVAKVMPWYLVGVVGWVASFAVSRAFYALDDTVSPTLIGLAGILLYFLLAPLMIAKMSYVGLGVNTAMYWTTTQACALVVLWLKLRCPNVNGLLASVARIATGSVAAGMICALIFPVLSGHLSVGIAAIASACSALSAYVLLSALLMSKQEREGILAKLWVSKLRN